jgi:hypothetical protein
VLFDIFINCGSSSRHFIPVLAGEKKTTVVFVDGKKAETPAAGYILNCWEEWHVT